MLSQLMVLAHQIKENTFHFLCPPNASLSDLKLALCQFIKEVADIEEQVIKAQQAQAEEAKSKAEQQALQEPPPCDQESCDVES